MIKLLIFCVFLSIIVGVVANARGRDGGGRCRRADSDSGSL